MCTLVNSAIQRCRNADAHDVGRTDSLGVASMCAHKLATVLLSLPPWILIASGVSANCWCRLGEECYDGAVPLVALRAARCLGVAAVLACCAGYVWVHCAMGASWDPVPTAKARHALVTRGPFRFARHPMYTIFVVYLFAGPLLANLNWLLALAYLPFVALILCRIRTEERILLDLFGDEYVEYRRRVGALAPKCCRLCTLPRGLVGYGAPSRNGGETASSWGKRRSMLLDEASAGGRATAYGTLAEGTDSESADACEARSKD